MHPFLTQGFSVLPCVPEGGLEPPRFSPRQGAADQDPAQGILLPSHRHRWADVQVAEGVKAGDGFPRGLAGHIAKIGALEKREAVMGTPWAGDFGETRGVGHAMTHQDLFKSKILQASVPGRVKDDREGLVRRFHIAKLQLVLLWEEEEEEEGFWQSDSHLGEVCGEGGAGNGANLAKPSCCP